MDCLLTLFFTSNTALGGAPLDGTVTLGHLSGGGGSHWAGGTLRYLDAGGGGANLTFHATISDPLTEPAACSSILQAAPRLMYVLTPQVPAHCYRGAQGPQGQRHKRGGVRERDAG